MFHKKFAHSINVNFNNEKDEFKLFIKNFEHNLKKFISLSQKNNKFSKQNKTKYTPEKTLLSAAFTLLEGPTLSGKTTFLESVCDSVSNNEIKLEYIDKINFINLLNYIPSYEMNNSINLFINDLLDVLNKNSNARKNLYKYLLTSIKNNNLDRENINFDLVNKEINKPILFIIDNIEKINLNFEIILRIINKLSFVKNFVFLFVVDQNFNKFVVNNSNKNDELNSTNYNKLKNFVNLPIYIFNQDYTCLLKKYDLDSNLIINLNDILMKHDDNFLSLKDLDILLSTKIENNNYINKYKLLSSLCSLLPNKNSLFFDVFSKNINAFYHSLKDLYKFINDKFLIANEFIKKHSSLYSLNNEHWINSNIGSDLAAQFQNLYSKYSYDKNWDSLNNMLLDVSKWVDREISNIENEIEIIEKNKKNKKILKIKKSKVNDENLTSIIDTNFNNYSLEIKYPETLSDHLVNNDLEEIDKNNKKLEEIKNTLNNLTIIKNNFKEYFEKIKNNINELPKKINSLIKNNIFTDEINILNEILNDREFKDYIRDLELYRGLYKELLKANSLKEILMSGNLISLDELIYFINNGFNNYILGKYK